MTRHIKIAYLSDTAIVMLLNWATQHKLPDYIAVPKIATGIPEGARIVGVQTDWARCTICIMLEHESFPEVANGERCGELVDPIGIEFDIVCLDHALREETERLRADNLKLRLAIRHLDDVADADAI